MTIVRTLFLVSYHPRPKYYQRKLVFGFLWLLFFITSLRIFLLFYLHDEVTLQKTKNLLKNI